MVAEGYARSFSGNVALPSAAVDFAISATLAQLGPADWQVSEDVGAACARLFLTFDRTESTSMEPITVAVKMAPEGITVTVTNAAGSSDSEVVEPRRPFTSLQG